MDDDEVTDHLRARYRPWLSDTDPAAALPPGVTGCFRVDSGAPRGRRRNLAAYLDGPRDALPAALSGVGEWFAERGADLWLQVGDDEILWADPTPLAAAGFIPHEEVDVLVTRMTAARWATPHVTLETPSCVDEMLPYVSTRLEALLGYEPAASIRDLWPHAERAWRGVQERGHHYLVARVQGAPAGTGRVSRGVVPVIDQVATVERWRRRGVATTMIGELVRHALAGSPICAAYTVRDSAAARIFLRQGFRRLAGLRLYCRPVSVARTPTLTGRRA